MDVFITSTSLTGLSPAGPPASRSHSIVAETLRRELGANHARLFSDPVPNEFGDGIDWYTDAGTQPTRLSDLSDENAARVKATLSDYQTEIRAVADRFTQGSDSQQEMLSIAITQALEIPDERSVFAVQDRRGDWQPVLVNWGYVGGGASEVRGVLTGLSQKTTERPASTTPNMVMASAVAPIPPEGSDTMRWLWLLLGAGWLLLALLVAWILALTVFPCGVLPFRFAQFCPTPVVAEADVLRAERLVLEDQLFSLEAELAVLDRACQPQQARVTQPERDALNDRLQQQGGTLGDLNFALFWNSHDDLDVHVTCPAGETIHFNRKAACSGTLDLDANDRTPYLSAPVENVYFENPAPGIYQIRVHLYASRTSEPKPFTLRIGRKDAETRDLTGQVSTQNPEWFHQFTLAD
ncbi:MAG: hypothetical protein AAF755_07885 [Pseudomonadota bacterium]